MMPAWVRTCSRFASRAMKLGASSRGSKMLRLTMMIVSTVGGAGGAGTVCASIRSGVATASSAATVPTTMRSVRRTAGLFEQVNALVQRVGHVPCGVVPFCKIQSGVNATGDLPQAAGREQKRPSDGIRLHGPAETCNRPIGGDARGRRPDRVGDVLPQVSYPSEVERDGQGVLVSLALRRVEVVANETHVPPPAGGRVQREAGHAEGAILARDHPAMPLPAGGALVAPSVAGAGSRIATPPCK